MLEEQAYDRIDAADDAVADAPPAVGPGGLQNVSKTSAWAAGGGVDAAPVPRARHLQPRRRPPPEPRASPQTRLEHRVRQSLRRTTAPISHGPRASRHERRRVALCVVAVHVFLARKLGVCPLPVVALGAVVVEQIGPRLLRPLRLLRVQRLLLVFRKGVVLRQALACTQAASEKQQRDRFHGSGQARP